MTQNTDEKRPGLRGWLRILLVASLALNLLIIGVIGGAVVKRGKWRDHHVSRLDMAAGPLTRALSKEDRRAIGREMRRLRREGQNNDTNRRADLAGLIADLKAVPFESVAIASRLENHHQVMLGRVEQGQMLLLERLTSMTDTERAAYADRLQQGIHQWREKRSSQ